MKPGVIYVRRRTLKTKRAARKYMPGWEPHLPVIVARHYIDGSCYKIIARDATGTTFETYK